MPGDNLRHPESRGIPRAYADTPPIGRFGVTQIVTAGGSIATKTRVFGLARVVQCLPDMTTATNAAATTPSYYIVRSSAACMPVNCWGRYRRVAVLEVDEDVTTVSMISERAKGVRSIVRTWERLNVGTTERCAYELALAEAEALADALNKEV